MNSVIIPTLNEEQTVADVIRRSKPFADEVLLIDGGSTDRTCQVASDLGVPCVQQTGKGKGQALRQAAAQVKGDILVFIDADGSHIPEDIPRLTGPILNKEADMVIASRLLGGSSELHGGFDEFLRLAGSSFITACINCRFKVRLSDSQNGFRAIRRDVFLALGLKSRHTTIEQDMLMGALSKGFKVKDIPSHELIRQGGVSKVSVFGQWHQYVWSLTRGMIRG